MAKLIGPANTGVCEGVTDTRTSRIALIYPKTTTGVDAELRALVLTLENFIEVRLSFATLFQESFEEPAIRDLVVAMRSTSSSLTLPLLV